MLADNLRHNIYRAQQLAQQQRMLGGNIRRAAQGDQFSVGACQASPWPPSAGYGTGQYGSQYSPNNDLNPGLPQNAPWVPPQALVNPYQVLQQNYTPLGFRVQANSPAGTSTTIVIAPNQGLFYIAGIRAFNQPDEIEILRVSTGGADIARNAASFDFAAYNTIECFCPVEWGCISNQSPMTLTFASIGTPSTAPFINGVLFGTYQQSFNSCYPGLPTAIGLQPGVYGQPAAGAIPAM